MFIATNPYQKFHRQRWFTTQMATLGTMIGRDWWGGSSTCSHPVQHCCHLSLRKVFGPCLGSWVDAGAGKGSKIVRQQNCLSYPSPCGHTFLLSRTKEMKQLAISSLEYILLKGSWSTFQTKWSFNETLLTFGTTTIISVLFSKGKKVIWLTWDRNIWTGSVSIKDIPLTIHLHCFFYVLGIF